MLVASTSVVGFGFRSGKLRTSKCLPICPRKRTYLPILERLPPPALGERRHRGHTRRLVSVRRAAYVGLPLWSLVHIQMDAQSFREVLHHREGPFVPLG